MKDDKNRLVFYCQLCKASIQGNICPEHGIDFVTILKLVNKGAYGKGGQKSGTPKNTTGVGPGEEQGLSLKKKRYKKKDSTFLPVLPTETGEENLPSPFERSIGENSGSFSGASGDVTDYIFAHDAEYQELDPEETARYYAEQRRYRKNTQRESSQRSLWFSVVGIMSIIILAGIYLGAFYQSQSAAELYTRAETHYLNKEYAAAAALYRQIVSEFPNDALTGMAAQRGAAMDVLSAGGAGLTKEQQEQIQGWMIKANIAFENGEYLKPAGRSTLHYVKQVMSLEPRNAAALEMQARLTGRYENLAMAALQQNNYDAALGHYQKILEIRPGDSETIEKMRRILEMKTAY